MTTMTNLTTNRIAAARMSGRVTIVRIVEVDGSRVRVEVRRRKQARLPIDRIVLPTDHTAHDDNAVAEFRQQADAIANDIDLAELWETVCDEPDAISLDDLAELYWASEPTTEQRIGMLLCLDRDTLYFTDAKIVGGIPALAPRTPTAVEETLARRRRQAQQAADADELVACLSARRLPPTPSPHQRLLLDGILGYAVHGDDHTRSAIVKPLLGRLSGSTGKRKSGDLQQLAFDTLTAAGVLPIDEPIELMREGVEEDFSGDAITAADAIDIEPLLADPVRLDLTALSVITIDDADTTDRDDAISLERLSQEQGGGWRLGVHITDAAALIPKGGALDDEASRRISTLYIPDRKTPMLPTAISQDKGSLEPGERRIALSLLANLDDDGAPLGVDVRLTLIRSSAALSYEDADAAITDDGHPYHDMLSDLHTLTLALKRRRDAAGAVGIDKPEMQIRLARDTAHAPATIQVRVVERDTAARQMVAECMVLCNALTAAFCRDRDIPAAYRSQPAPDLSDLAAGLPPNADMSDGPLRWYLMMRRFAPAQTSTTPAAHNGLGVDAYTQVTSPLRRYSDLVMQRQISHFLRCGEPLYAEDEIADVAARADVQMRQLSKLEDERRRYWLLKFFAQQGRIADANSATGSDTDASLFQAVVLENRAGRSAQLELVEYPYRVRVRLPDAIVPGEVVMLRLHGIDLWQKRPQFTHVPMPG